MLNADKEINLLASEQCSFPVYLEANFFVPTFRPVRKDNLQRTNFGYWSTDGSRFSLKTLGGKS
jgi:hypothetical protein